MRQSINDVHNEGLSLLERLAEASMMSPHLLSEEMNNPDWERDITLINWRLFIPESLREVWFQLSLEARLAAYQVAEAAVLHELDM